MIIVRNSDNRVLARGTNITLDADKGVVDGRLYYGGVKASTCTIFPDNPPANHSRYTFDGTTFTVTPAGLEKMKEEKRDLVSLDASTKTTDAMDTLDLINEILSLLQDLGGVAIDGDATTPQMQAKLTSTLAKFNQFTGIKTSLSAKLSAIDSATTPADLDAI